MSDIVEMLRNRSFRLATRDFNGDGASLAKEAADEITRLRAALVEERKLALESAANVVEDEADNSRALMLDLRFIKDYRSAKQLEKEAETLLRVADRLRSIMGSLDSG